MTFLMVDVDNFKAVNTRFGHLTGDFVLAEIASLLKASIRGSDAIIRYGGDEFLILLTDTADAGAETVLARIHQRTAEWNDSNHIRSLRIGLSVGVAEWHDGQTIDEVLDSADRRMYENKAIR